MGEPALNILETAPNKDTIIPKSFAIRLLLEVILMGKMKHKNPYEPAISWDIYCDHYNLIMITVMTKMNSIPST